MVLAFTIIAGECGSGRALHIMPSKVKYTVASLYTLYIATSSNNITAVYVDIVWCHII